MYIKKEDDIKANEASVIKHTLLLISLAQYRVCHFLNCIAGYLTWFMLTFNNIEENLIIYQNSN